MLLFPCFVSSSHRSMSECWKSGMDGWTGFLWMQITGFNALELFEVFWTYAEMAWDQATQKTACSVISLPNLQIMF